MLISWSVIRFILSMWKSNIWPAETNKTKRVLKNSALHPSGEMFGLLFLLVVSPRSGTICLWSTRQCLSAPIRGEFLWVRLEHHWAPALLGLTSPSHIRGKTPSEGLFWRKKLEEAYLATNSWRAWAVLTLSLLKKHLHPHLLLVWALLLTELNKEKWGEWVKLH